MSDAKKRPQQSPQTRRRAHRRRHPDPGQPSRRRGGQPGNTNALKHGLYSRTLPPAAQEAFDQARRLPVTDLTEEIAALRARLAALSPYQLAAFYTGVSLLSRLVAAQHRMSPQQAQDLSQAIAETVRQLGMQLYPVPQDD